MSQGLSIHSAARKPVQTPLLVGRATELEQLHNALQRALDGAPQFVFLTGEPGIGKTTLVDTFLRQLAVRSDLQIAQGQCIEHYGPGEAYLPLLDASSRSCRAAGGQRLIELLKKHAPTWLIQLPALLDETELEALQRRVQGATQERMLREMAEATEVMTAETGAVLVLEDLQWSDVSTLEWMGYLARRREPAQLLLIGTYRPAEVLASGHPLKGVVQELKVRGQCEELSLSPLPEQAVGEYITGRFTGAVLPPELPAVIHRRTGGNPLFVVNVIDHLTRQGVLREEAGVWRVPDDLHAVEEGVPENLRHLIEKQLAGLSGEQQRVLEIASVAGMEFTVAAVATGVRQEDETIEELCEELAAREQFIEADGVVEWPDGTLGGQYRFRHAFYQHVLYERIAEARRVRLHRRIGEREERGYSNRAKERAAELAVHFEQGRDYKRAAQYRRQAGENAFQRSAHRETINHLTKGLELLKFLPDTPERARQELALQLSLGTVLEVTQSSRILEAEGAYGRALELCHQANDTPQLVLALYGLGNFYLSRGELQTAREMREQLLQLAQNNQDSSLLMEAHYVMGEGLFWLGELTLAQQHCEQSLSLYQPKPPNSLSLIHAGGDAKLIAPSYLSLILWLQGFPDHAQAWKEAFQTQARELAHPFSLLFAHTFAAFFHQLRRDEGTTCVEAKALITLATEQGFLHWSALGQIFWGWALAQQKQAKKGVVQIQKGLDASQITRVRIARTYALALLAEAYEREGRLQEGLQAVAESLAIAEETGERFYEAELYRLKGQLTLEAGGWRLETGLTSQASSLKPSVSKEMGQKVEGYFLKAIEIARRQAAKSLELRAVMSLSRLWRHQGKTAEARQLLEEIYSWFTEGFDTYDLQEAAAQLKALGSMVAMRQRPKTETAQLRVASVSPRARSLRLQHEPLNRPDLTLNTQHATSEERQPATDQHLVSRVRQRGSDESQTSQSHLSSSQPTPRSPQPTAIQDPDLESQHAAVFQREGEFWTLAFEGVVCRIKDGRGLHHIAQLLQHPHEEFHVLQLVAAGVALSESDQRGASRRRKDELSASERLVVSRLPGTGNVLAPRARATYKQRLADLRTELDEAQTFHDLARVAQLQEEMALLTQELAQAVGLGGQARKAGSPAERARVNVTRTIRAALKRIMASHPALGHHLTKTIKTGFYCSYTPDLRLPITWQV